MNMMPSVVGAALSLAAATPTLAAPLPDRLRCEYLVNPLGIDETHPRLSWILADAAHTRGLKQTAYRILVASSPERLAAERGDLWDTGRVTSDQTLNVVYDGKPLVSRMRCWWKVCVWTGGDTPSPWSKPALWSMGLLDASDWHAAWIGKDETPRHADNPLVAAKARWIWQDEATPNGNAPVGTRIFTRAFSVPAGGGPVSAEAWIACDNQGSVAINGHALGTAGSFKKARRFDLSRGLRPGENTLRIVVTNVGEAPNPAGLLAVIKVDAPAGQTATFVSDASWKSAESATGPVHPVKVLAEVGQGPWGEVLADDEDRVLPARHLRKPFALKESPVRATATLVGLGYYEFYINGEKVGDRVLDPILTDYAHRVPYVTYDVTDRLRRGDNVAGILLGNGRFFAPRLGAPTHTQTYGYPKLLFQLELEYPDGRTERVISDTTWRLTDAGPIRANNDYDGETYDARRELTGWASPGYDDSGWQPAQAVGAPGGLPVAAMMPPMRVTDTLQPLAITTPRPGVWIFDLGQNMVGWCRINVDLPADWTLVVRHAEHLGDDGLLYVANLRGARCTDRYVSAGHPAVYEPRFTYHGFRFAEITLEPPTPEATTAFIPTRDTLRGRVVHTDLPLVGSFVTSHPLVNRVYHNIEWGVRGNYLSIPTDCPQRDERQGWQGDRAAESMGEMFMFDNVTLYRKWMQDVEDSQRPDGVLSSVCPNYWPMYPGDVTWPSAFTIIPDSLRIQYGETRCFAAHYDAMTRWLKSFEPHIKNGLLDRDTYGDWCVPPERPELIHSQDPARRTSKTVLATTYYIYNLGLVAGYADQLGKTADAAALRARAAEMTRAFNAAMLHADSGRYDNGTQTAAVLPLAFGIVPKPDEQKVFDALVSNILVNTDGHIGTGLIGGQWLNRVLTAHGRPDISFKLLTNTTYPSWGYMVENGATTMWELWNGNTADPAMNSGNHVMLVGDLTTWLYETLAGIKSDPAHPGFERIVMHPYFPDGLDFVRAAFDSVRGRIESQWQRDGKRVAWHVVIPPNTTAEIRLPTGDAQAPAAIREGGKPAAEAAGLKRLRTEAGAVVFDVQPGEYRFETRL